MSLMSYTYLLYSEKDGRWSTGTPRDLRTRVKAHANGRVWSTRSRRPWQRIYDEACRRHEDAMRRERYLKTGRGKRYLRQRLGVEWTSLSVVPTITA